MTFWPQWPYMTPDWHWPHNIGKSVTQTSYSIYSENNLLTAETPNDPRLTFDPITWVEGLKLMHMYESYGHAM